jgi:hypothetical protein
LSSGDGLQILRYNVSTSYNSHLDYIEDRSGQLEHDFDSSGTGGNRFATILLYMSDLGPDDGGETVFPKVWPPTLPVEERISTQAVSFTFALLLIDRRSIDCTNRPFTTKID